MSELYDYPEYYEIAFSWRDIKAEADLFEDCFKKYSKIPVKSVLEVGCGNTPHMEELVKRGYAYIGLDISEKMLDFSRQKAKESNIDVKLIRGDMVDFTLDKKVDFAYILLGSLFSSSTKELIRHFDSVANALNIGGLYLLDWCVQFEIPMSNDEGISWEMERDSIKVKTTNRWKPLSLARQVFEETITFEVDDHGKKIKIEGKDIHRALYPQEFLRFIESRNDFEFIGWWNNWNLNEPLENAIKIDRPVKIIRRI